VVEIKTIVVDDKTKEVDTITTDTEFVDVPLNDSTDDTSKKIEESSRDMVKSAHLISKMQNSKNFTVFPIQNQQLWQMYNKQEGSFWRATEVDLSNDMKDWDKLTVDEKYFIKNILAFFAGSDGIVNWNISSRFKEDIDLLGDKFKEAKLVYSFQEMMENIHGIMYSLLIETYIKDDDEKAHLFNAIETIPCVKQKAEWAMKWIMDKESSFSQRLVAFAIVEGIFFSGSFCAIYWLKKRGLMPGLTAANEFIARDEGMHTETACIIYKLIDDPISKSKICEMLDEAIKIEKQFITESIPCDLIGMNSPTMCQYIEFVADNLLVNLGYEKMYNVEFPSMFSFMDAISIQGKTNFFEKRPTEYQKANIGSVQLVEDF
jgi:ribonucleotide reductase beta subunit family protein with ferritin-like domain